MSKIIYRLTLDIELTQQPQYNYPRMLDWLKEGLLNKILRVLQNQAKSYSGYNVNYTVRRYDIK